MLHEQSTFYISFVMCMLYGDRYFAFVEQFLVLKMSDYLVSLPITIAGQNSLHSRPMYYDEIALL